MWLFLLSQCFLIIFPLKLQLFSCIWNSLGILCLIIDQQDNLSTIITTISTTTTTQSSFIHFQFFFACSTFSFSIFDTTSGTFFQAVGEPEAPLFCGTKWYHCVPWSKIALFPPPALPLMTSPLLRDTSTALLLVFTFPYFSVSIYYIQSCAEEILDVRISILRMSAIVRWILFVCSLSKYFRLEIILRVIRWILLGLSRSFKNSRGSLMYTFNPYSHHLVWGLKILSIVYIHFGW